MSQPKVIGFHYTLTDASGTVLDSSRDGGEPLLFLEGSGNIIEGLEKELLLLSVGQKKVVKVAAKDAYGEKRDDMIAKVPKSQFGQEVKVGDRFQSGPGHHAPIFTVIALSGEEVTLDGNHPLAGVDLTFDVEIMSSRAATKDELSHGHAHGEGGHHH